MSKQVKVVIAKDELKNITCPDIYIENKLRRAGIPVTGLFTFTSMVENETLSKKQIGPTILEYTWEQE